MTPTENAPRETFYWHVTAMPSPLDEPQSGQVALSEDAAAAVADEARARTDLAAAILVLLDKAPTNDPEDAYARYLAGVAARFDLDLEAAVNPVAGWWIEEAHDVETIWRIDPARTWAPVNVLDRHQVPAELWEVLAAIIPVEDTTQDEDDLVCGWSGCGLLYAPDEGEDEIFCSDDCRRSDQAEAEAVAAGECL